jgi:hypothetical protein
MKRYKLIRNHESELEGGIVEELFDAATLKFTDCGDLIVLSVEDNVIRAYAAHNWIMLKEVIE